MAKATMTLRRWNSFIRKRFNGELHGGAHPPDGVACALEAFSQAEKMEWTDSPEAVGMWDLRALNDINVSPEVRAEHIGPVVVAYWRCVDWSRERKQAVASKLTILTVNRIVSELPYLTEAIRYQCRSSDTLDSAISAALAAESALSAWSALAAWSASSAWSALAAEAAWSALSAWSASSAAESALSAAESAQSARSAALSAALSAAQSAQSAAWSAEAASSARETVFIVACKVWVDATK